MTSLGLALEAITQTLRPARSCQGLDQHGVRVSNPRFADNPQPSARLPDEKWQGFPRLTHPSLYRRPVGIEPTTVGLSVTLCLRPGSGRGIGKGMSAALPTELRSPLLPPAAQIDGRRVATSGRQGVASRDRRAMVPRASPVPHGRHPLPAGRPCGDCTSCTRSPR